MGAAFATRAARAPRGQPVVVLLYALVVLTMASEAAVPALLPTFKRELGLATFETSALLGASWAMMLASAMPVGAASDRFGARVVTLLGGVMLCAGSAIQGLGDSFWMLLVGRAVFGVALGTLWTAGIAWIAAQPRAGARALGGTTPAAALGGIVGPFAAGVLAGSLGTGAPFLVYAAVGVVVTALLGAVPAVGTEVVPARDPIARTARQVAGQPLVVAGVVLVLLTGIATGATNVLVPLELGERGLSAAQIGAIFSAQWIVFLVVTTLAAGRGDTLSTVRVAAIGLIGSAVVLLLPVVNDATITLVAFVVLRVVAAWGLLATITYPLAVAGAHAGRLRAGAVLGMVNVGWGLSSTVGPLAGGLIGDTVGTSATFALISLTFALVGTALLFADRRSRSVTPVDRGSEACAC